MPDLVFYLLVFLAVGVFFLFIHLMIGKLIRPFRPDDEKMTIYECGEPTVGSAWIQFDLRYYVVALLFVVFDVEVAFFFPWAVVFGKANELARTASMERRTQLTKELVPADLNLVYLEAPPAEQQTNKTKAQAGGKKGGKGMPKGLPDGAAQVGVPKGEFAKGMPKDMPKDGAPMLGPMPGMPKGGAPSTSPFSTEKPAPADVQPIDQQTAKSWAWIAFFDILVFFGVLMVGFAYLWRRGDIDWVRSTAAEKQDVLPV